MFLVKYFSHILKCSARGPRVLAQDASAGPQTSEFKELLDYAWAELEHAFYAVIISDRFQSARLINRTPQSW